MKRDLKITLFSILILVLVASCNSKKYIKNELNLNSLWTIKYDTSNLIHLLKIDTFRLSVIPPSSGVQFYKDGIVFLSSSKYEKKMSPKQISFGTFEAYYASVQDSVPGKRTVFSPSSSFSFPCEAMTFSHNYDTVYYTKFPQKDKKEKIFMATFTPKRSSLAGLVAEKSPLDFCNDDYSYSHPAISADEKIMIFASDRKSSLGGMDLFISRKVGKKWSSPENLGKSINTNGNEFFPFLDSENNLFFSSDGQPGYGGYDIFACKFNGKDWDNPLNLSDYINSNNDDIAFTINKTDGKTAFFTRRQKSGKGEMQLFKISLKKEIADQNLLTISNIINGKPVSTTGMLAANNIAEVKKVEAAPVTEKPTASVMKKEEVKVADTTVGLKKILDKVIAAKPETKTETNIKTTENKTVTSKTAITEPVEQKGVVVYRVQIISSSSQKSNKEIIINGNNYNLYEYFYLGAYRCTIGEFSKLQPAIELKKICRQSGYPQAFVVAFKNNTRSLDISLFK